MTATEPTPRLCKPVGWRRVGSLVALLALTVLVNRPALAQPYSVAWHTVDGGGGSSTGGVFTLSGALGQPDAGVLVGGAFGISGGFFGVSFVPAAPTVTSPTVALITATGATLGGDATEDGGSTITARGIVYSATGTNNDPQIGGVGVINVPVGGTTGVFTTGVTGLTASTGYSFRAYATNALGTGYTSVATFMTSAPGCPTITLASLPNGTLGAAYAGSATASGGAGPYTYAVTVGPLPAGLLLTGSGLGAGDVTGTPTATGSFQITATDSNLCVGVGNVALIGSAIAAGDLVIREFRLRGPAATNGESDEYVVIHNRRTTPLTVATADGSSGFGVAASDGSLLFTIPNGTVIKPRGHFLGVNTTGFSLGITHDASWSTDVADGSGLALFKTASPGGFSSGTRLDAVGFGTGVAPYFEGATLTSLGTVDGEYAWVRKAPSGVPQDTNANAADFALVATDAGMYGSVQSILGSPTPAGSDTWDVYSLMSRVLVEPTVGVNVAPNRIRTGSGNSGTLEFRVRAKNNGTTSIAALRLRVLDLTTLQSPGYSVSTQADIRPVNGPDVTIPATTIGVTDLAGLTLETPPAQALGGGWNSTLSIPLSTPLLPGGTVDFNLVFNIHRSGSFRYWITYEAGQ